MPKITVKLPKQLCMDKIEEYISKDSKIHFYELFESEIRIRYGAIDAPEGLVYFEGNGKTEIEIKFEKISSILWFIIILIIFTSIGFIFAQTNSEILSIEFYLILSIFLGTFFGLFIPFMANLIISRRENEFTKKIRDIFII